MVPQCFADSSPTGIPTFRPEWRRSENRPSLKECGERAKAAIRADPWRLARLVAIRAVDYWAGTVFTHAPAGGSGWPRSAPRAAATLFMSGEVLLIVLCLLTRRRTGTDLRFLLAIVVSFSIIYCLTHVEAKYRVPTEPSIAIIAAALAIDVLRSWTRGPSGMDNSSRLTRGGHN